ncbi:unnamed protein product [Brachionus calyciflorus]|uniref:Uncharacterized protein n=1 Tax=Brachionus calyciflorus TaxID=104777 RepID=A0A814I5X9_9BILA|nr:unnamed protein product [Brachionus calyciflorus]
MSKTIKKQDILDYYDDLLNKIDTQSEKILSKQGLSEDGRSTINQERSKIMSKIKHIEKINLDSFYFQPFCFFVPNEKILTNKIAHRTKYEFKNEIGKLIILNNQIDSDLAEKISNFINHGKIPDDFYFDSFKDVLEFTVTNKLIENNFNNLIIDLSNSDLNILKQLELDDYTKRFKRIRLENINFLETLINIRSVECLKTTISKMYPFPNFFGYFPCLKNLEIYDANLEFIPSNAFSNLLELETLLIHESRVRSIEKDAFSGLKSLKKLDLRYGRDAETLDNDIFKDLINLEELFIESFDVSIIEQNAFKNLKKLQTLFLSKNKIEQMTLNGLTSLKHFYLIGERNKFEYNSNFFKYCPNLTVIYLENSFKSQLPADIFNSLQCLKYLEFGGTNSNIKILTNLDFLKPLHKLEYLHLTLNESLFESFSQVKLPNLKYLSIKCRTIPLLEDNFENLVTLKIDLREKLTPGCLNKQKGIKNLLLIFDDNRKLGYIDSTFFNTLDNLDYLNVRSHSYSSIGGINLKTGECFAELFDKRKKLKKKIDPLVEISNEEAVIDVYFGLSDEVKNAIETVKLALSIY